jgi:hypothetical protein
MLNINTTALLLSSSFPKVSGLKEYHRFLGNLYLFLVNLLLNKYRLCLECFVVKIGALNRNASAIASEVRASITSILSLSQMMLE